MNQVRIMDGICFDKLKRYSILLLSIFCLLFVVLSCSFSNCLLFSFFSRSTFSTQFVVGLSTSIFLDILYNLLHCTQNDIFCSFFFFANKKGKKNNIQQTSIFILTLFISYTLFRINYNKLSLNMMRIEFVDSTILTYSSFFEQFSKDRLSVLCFFFI